MFLHRRLVALLGAGAVTVSTVFVAGSAAAAPSKPKAPSTHVVGVGSNPYDVAISQSLGKAFVVNDGSVSVVSLLTHREIAEFGTGGYHGQNAIALVHSGTQGYITNYETKSVAVFDTETHKVIRQIGIGGAGVDVVRAGTPKGERAYVSVLANDQVVGIQTSSGKVVQRIKLPDGAQTLTTRPGGKAVWAGSSYDGRVYVVSTTSGKVTKTINVDRSGPVSSIAFAPGAKKAWVAGLGGVSVVDTATGKTVTFIPVTKIFTAAPNVGSVALTGSGRYALVEDSTFPDQPTRGTVSVIDTRTYKVVYRVRTGVEPEGMALDNQRRVAYVPNYGDDTVTYFAIPK